MSTFVPGILYSFPRECNATTTPAVSAAAAAPTPAAPASFASPASPNLAAALPSAAAAAVCLRVCNPGDECSRDGDESVEKLTPCVAYPLPSGHGVRRADSAAGHEGRQGGEALREAREARREARRRRGACRRCRRPSRRHRDRSALSHEGRAYLAIFLLC
jgi:hypothetical protein